MESRIEEIRKEHGMSQDELAEKLSVSRQTVSEWERGITYPSVAKLVMISNLFDVSLDYIVNGKVYGDKEENETSFLKFSSKLNARGYVVGKKNGMVASIPETEFVGNTLVCGRPGSGKSTTYLVPNILNAIKRKETVVSVALDKELLPEIEKQAIDVGYRIIKLDFTDLIGPQQKIDLVDEVFDKNGKPSYDLIKLLYRNIVHKEDYLVFALFVNMVSNHVKLKNIADMDVPHVFGSPNFTEDYIRSHTNDEIKNAFMGLKFHLNALNSDANDLVSENSVTLSDMCQEKTIAFINPVFTDPYIRKLTSSIINMLLFKISTKQIMIEGKMNLFIDMFGTIEEQNELLKYTYVLPKNISMSVLVQSIRQLRCSHVVSENAFENLIFMDIDSSTIDSDIITKVTGIDVSKKTTSNDIIYKRRSIPPYILQKYN